MATNKCDELTRRIGVSKEITKLVEIPTVRESRLPGLLHDFHELSNQFVLDMLFDSEYNYKSKKLLAQIKSVVEGLLSELDDSQTPIILDQLASIAAKYAFWWSSLDVTASPTILAAIAKAVFRAAEMMFKLTQVLEFKQLMIRITRDYNVEIKPVPTVEMGKVGTFKLVRSFVRQTEAFNNFESAIRKAGLISDSTRKKVFRAAFKDEGMPEKIIWLGTIAELRFLVKGLLEKDIVKDPGQNIWRLTLDCFEIAGADGKSFSELRRSLREAKRPSAERVGVLEGCLGQLKRN